MRDSRNLREKPKECGTFEALTRGTSKKVEEMHRTGSCYKYSITAENSTTRDSTYIEVGFRLQIRFVETEWGGGGGGRGGGGGGGGGGEGKCSTN